MLVALLAGACSLQAVAFATAATHAAPWPGTVYGSVLNGETGRAVGGVLVELLTAGDMRAAGPVTTDQRGTFSLKAPRPGEYMITARHSDYRMLSVPLLVGLDPLPQQVLKLDQYHSIDAPPEPPAGSAANRSAYAYLLGTLLPGLAIGLLLAVGAARSREPRGRGPGR